MLGDGWFSDCYLSNDAAACLPIIMLSFYSSESWYGWAPPNNYFSVYAFCFLLELDCAEGGGKMTFG